VGVVLGQVQQLTPIVLVAVAVDLLMELLMLFQGKD
jgi:hypothetical protein